MSRRLRDFSNLLEKTLVAERSNLDSRPASTRPRLRPEDQMGILWDRFRSRSTAEERALIKMADECAA